MSPAAPLASSNNPCLSKIPPSQTFRSALDYAWDPFDFFDVGDWYGARFVNGEWHQLDEDGDYM